MFPRALRSVWVVVAAYFLTYLLIMPESIRYLVPIIPLFALVIASGACIGAEKSKLVKAVVMVWIAVLIGFHFPGGSGHLWKKSKFVLPNQSVNAYLRENLDIFPISQWANENLKSPDRLLSLNDIRGFYMDCPYVWGNPIGQKYIDYDQVQSVSELLERWQSKGVTHVLLKSDHVFWPSDGQQALYAFLNQSQPAVRRGRFSVYRIPRRTAAE